MEEIKIPERDCWCCNVLENKNKVKIYNDREFVLLPCGEEECNGSPILISKKHGEINMDGLKRAIKVIERKYGNMRAYYLDFRRSPEFQDHFTIHLRKYGVEKIKG